MPIAGVVKEEICKNLTGDNRSSERNSQAVEISIIPIRKSCYYFRETIALPISCKYNVVVASSRFKYHV